MKLSTTIKVAIVTLITHTIQSQEVKKETTPTEIIYH